MKKTPSLVRRALGFHCEVKGDQHDLFVSSQLSFEPQYVWLYGPYLDSIQVHDIQINATSLFLSGYSPIPAMAFSPMSPIDNPIQMHCGFLAPETKIMIRLAHTDRDLPGTTQVSGFIQCVVWDEPLGNSNPI